MAHPLPSPPRLVLFDLDDTVLDNRSAAQHALHACVGERSDIFGTITGEQAFERWVGINVQLWNDYGRGVLNERQLRHQRAARLLVWACDTSGACYTESAANEFMERYFELFIAAARPLDGVPELLDYLHSETSLGVVTNGFADVQRARLDAAGLASRFGHVIISEEVGHRKPQPEIFRHALDLFGVQPDEAVMVGDSLDYDIAGAHAAGLATVWLRSAGDGRDATAVATASVVEIAELAQLLRSSTALPHAL